MVRSYMRHGPTQAFGVITSPTGNASFHGKLAYVPAWEDVLVWDVKRGEQVSMWHSPGLTAPITALQPSPSPSATASGSSTTTENTYAVAYSDGSIRLWSHSPSNPSEEASEMVTFNGHKKSPTFLCWDADGSRLASGGTEGEIVIWDVVGEVGLYRLRGHRGPITGLRFVPSPSGGVGYLISTSRDTYMKVWDLGTQHCVQTVVVGRGEVTALGILEEAGELAEDGRWVVITGSSDGEAKVWELPQSALASGLTQSSGELTTFVKPLCTLPLSSSSQPVTQIASHPTLPLLFLHTGERAITVLRLRTEEEVNAKRARRKRRDREKSKKKGAAPIEEEESGAEGEEEAEVKWEERVAVWTVVRTNAKIKSFDLADEYSSKSGVHMLVQLSNNSLETYSIPLPTPSARKASKLPDGTTPQPTKTHGLELQGHRQDIRALSLSSDDQLIASASSGTLKIWNTRTTACLRTMECGYALCSTFLPGDRHVVVGTKSGEIMLYDIAASTLLETYKAHSGPVWAVHVRPDGRGLVTGSADKDVKFFDFEMRSVGSETQVSRLGVETTFSTKQLSLVHVRTLKLTDDVLAVKYSPDGRLLAVALLDTTVKLFFADSLKFYLSLYGHKLPVLSLDISADSKLLVTCSADKSVKLWGMDFGDCHRSLFAHDESVMQVAFERIPRAMGEAASHLFWSVGKDGKVKYWDGDKFELIQSLSGHQSEIWALAVSSRGEFVVTGSHDKSIRIWEKTEEPLFLEEERERELEQMYDTNLANELGGGAGEGGEGDEGEVEAVQKQTAESLMAGEKIMEAIELADTDAAAIKEYEEEKARLGDRGEALPPPKKSAELESKGLNGPEYLWEVVKGVKSAQMEDALLVLPFRGVVSFLGYLDAWAKSGKDPVLASRIMSFLLRTHHAQISSTASLRPTLLNLRRDLRAALMKERERMGYNLAALKFIKTRWEAERSVGMMEEEMGLGMDLDEQRARGKKEREDGVKKRKRVEVR